jgi:RNA polymerase sigma factor (sigma-70 family)
MSTTSSTQPRAGDLLSAEEEVDLAKQIEAGLYAEHLLAQADRRYDPQSLAEVARQGRAAFTRFVEANVRLAAFFARRRVGAGAGYGLSLEDLTSEGVLGVVRGVCKFDYTLGYKFSTYASWWIRNFQQQAVIASSLAKLSPRETAALTAWMMSEQDLLTELHRAPTLEEIAAAAGTTVKMVQKVRDMLRPPAALDQPICGQSPRTYADLLAAREEPVEDQPAHVEELLAVLPPRERAVVVDAFGLAGGPARSVEELARSYRLPAATIEGVLDRAVCAMRAAATSTAVMAA